LLSGLCGGEVDAAAEEEALVVGADVVAVGLGVDGVGEGAQRRCAEGLNERDDAGAAVKLPENTSSIDDSPNAVALPPRATSTSITEATRTPNEDKNDTLAEPICI
jgi:hypothetical protein